MTAPAPVSTAVPFEEKRNFPKCPYCGWRPDLKRYPEGITVLERLVQLAATVGRHLTRAEFTTPISDYKCKKCKAFVIVTVGDLLRN